MDKRSTGGMAEELRQQSLSGHALCRLSMGAACRVGFGVRTCKPTLHLYNARAQQLASSLQERWVRCMTVSQQ